MRRVFGKDTCSQNKCFLSDISASGPYIEKGSTFPYSPRLTQHICIGFPCQFSEKNTCLRFINFCKDNSKDTHENVLDRRRANSMQSNWIKLDLNGEFSPRSKLYLSTWYQVAVQCCLSTHIKDTTPAAYYCQYCIAPVEFRMR